MSDKIPKSLALSYGKYIYNIDINAITQSRVLLQHNKNKSIIVKSGSNDAVIFVVKYLNYYANHVEIKPPEYPLADNTNLHELFEGELHIFGILLDIDAKMQDLKNILNVAEELEIDSLIKKISAIICFFMMKLA